ncbi:MAG TPA: YeeE/YedE family protein [Burkholderiales bacterium]|nr:YeeE/YedE family protein [Burkholderiales bacterium]
MTARPYVCAFATGLLFGIGLLIAGMADPHKILAFLDLAGLWDPSLGLVMVGAIAMGSIGFTFAQRRKKTLLGGTMEWPTARHIDRRLVLGSLAFGIGWGLSGFCPGPALIATAAGHSKALVFTVFMVIGMTAYRMIERRRTLAAPSP